MSLGRFGVVYKYRLQADNISLNFLPNFLSTPFTNSNKMTANEQVKLSNFGDIFSLEGKVAVVTGGSRGLGLHAASGYIP